MTTASELRPAGQAEELRREAGERLWAAARSASVRMDFPSAVNLFDRAATLLPDEETGALLQEFGAALNRSGDADRARVVVDRAIDRASASNSRRVELLARLDRFWIPSGSPHIEAIRRDVPELIHDLEELGDDLGLTKAWQLVAQGERSRGRFVEGEEDLRRALLHARRLGDRLEESEILVALMSCFYYGELPVEECISRCEDALRERRGDWMVEASASACEAGLNAMLGSFDVARELLDRSQALCEEFNILNVYPTLERRDVEMLAGNAAGAEQSLRAAEAALSPLQEWWGLGFGLRAARADALCAQERYEEAERLTDATPTVATGLAPTRVPEWVAEHVLWQSARAKALARRGRPEEAEALGREAVALAEPTDGLNMRAGALMDQADVLRAIDRRAEAARSVDAALALYERKGNVVMVERARGFAEALDHAGTR